jgi:hypothetical protein
MSTPAGHCAIEDAKTVQETTPAILGSLLAFCLVVVLVLLIFWPIRPAWSLPLAYLLPVPALGVVVCLLRVLRHGPGKLPWLPFLIGSAYMLGGMAFDVLATVVHSPDLSDEGNPIARTLLDSGQGLTVVYLYGAGMQTLDAVGACVLWAAFLRHRHTWLRTTWDSGPQSLPQFLKAATGGARLSWREYFLPLRLSELKRISVYHLFWVLPPALLGACVERWYLGFAWYRILPAGHHYAVLVGGALLGVVAVLVWLAVQYSDHQRVRLAGP